MGAGGVGGAGWCWMLQCPAGARAIGNTCDFKCYKVYQNRTIIKEVISKLVVGDIPATPLPNGGK